MTLWAWERQTNASLAWSSGIDKSQDVEPNSGIYITSRDDGTDNFEITVVSVPKVNGTIRGEMYLDLPGGKKVLHDGEKFNGSQLKYLRYSATDDEPANNKPTFELKFTDRSPVGGIDRTSQDHDFSEDDAISHNYHFQINVAPNNDDPVLAINEGIGKNNDGQRHVISSTDPDSKRIIPITADLLQVTDVDSSAGMRTYTIKSVPEYGRILYGKNGTYSLLLAGSSFTQKDIDEGLLHFEFLSIGSNTWGFNPGGEPDNSDWTDGGGKYVNLHTDFSFTVMDGGVSSWVPGSGPQNGHQGGIYGNYGTDDPSNPYDSPAPSVGTPLKEIHFNIDLKVYERTGGDPINPPEPNRKPVVTIDKTKVGLISEGKSEDGLPEPSQGRKNFLVLTGYDYGNDVNGMININDPDTPHEAIVLSLLNDPVGGNLYLNGNRIFVGDKFTYAQLLAGNVKYMHAGGEYFQEDLRFMVSDGHSYVSRQGVNGDGALISLHLDIVPYNDRPSLSINREKLIVDEGGTLILNGSRYDSSGVYGSVFGYRDTDYIDMYDAYKPLYDKDGVLRDGNTHPYYAADPLTMIITSLPKHGKLQYFDGTEWKDVPLLGEFPLLPEFEVTQTMLTKGWFRYQHDGTEKFDDSFQIKMRDNSTEDGGSLQTAETVVYIKIRSINDAPVKDTGTNNGQVNVTGEPKEGEKVTIGGKNEVAANTPGIYYTDGDNDPDQIQYVISEACKYGTLYRKGENGEDIIPLGKGSSFTQAELDAGLIFYQDNGKNQHHDSFKYQVTDGSSSAPGGVQTYDIAITPVNEKPVFTGADLDLWLEDTYLGVLIEDVDAVGINKFIQVTDPDAEDFAPGVTRLNDYVELLVEAHKGSQGGAFVGEFSIDNLAALQLANPSLIINSSQTGIISITGKLGEVNNALKSLRFKGAVGNVDLNETAHIKFSINDCNNGGEGPDFTAGSSDALSAEPKWIKIHVSPDNNSPQRTVDTTNLTAYEDYTCRLFKNDLVTPPSNHNGLTTAKLIFTDIDAFDTKTNTCIITVLGGLGSVTYDGEISNELGVATDGNGIKFTGTLEAINKALNFLNFRATANYNGDVIVNVTYDDHGNTGKEGNHPTFVTQDFTVKVIAVNDAPQIKVENAPKTQVADGKITPTFEVDETTAFDGTKYTLNLNTNVKADDLYDLGKNHDISTYNNLTLTIKYTDRYNPSAQPIGTIVFGNLNGCSQVDSSNASSKTITLTGSLAQLKAALATMSYEMDKNAYMAQGANTSNLLNVVCTINDTGDGDGAGSPNPNNKTAAANFLININLVNSPPVIKGHDIEVYEDMYGVTDTKGINIAKIMQDAGQVLNVSDLDAFLNQVMYKIEIDGGGTLWLDGQNKGSSISEYVNKTDSAWASTGKTISALNGILAKLYFKPNADWNGDLNIKITVNDKGNTGTTGGTPPAGTTVVNGGFETENSFKITVKPVNDTPGLSSSTERTLTAVNEDSTNPAGDTVANLFSGLLTDAKDTETGQTGSLKGILIVIDSASRSTQGVWQYFRPGDTEWTDVTKNGDPVRSETNALYLDATTKLRFLPKGDFNGTPGKLTVRLLETMPIESPYGIGGTNVYPTLTSGGNIDIVNAFNGIDAAFRPYTDTIALGTSIKAINDAPKATINICNFSTIIEDNPHAGTLISALFGTGSAFDDNADNQKNHDGSTSSSANKLHGVVIVKNEVTVGGNWVYKDGTEWKIIPTTLDTDNGLFLLANTLIRFSPDANWNGTPGNLTVHLVDDSAEDAANGNPAKPLHKRTVDLLATGTGGNTRYSANAISLKVYVGSLNDAPVVIGGNTETLDTITEDIVSGSNTSGLNPGKTVSDIFKGHFNDERDQILNGSNANTFAGVLITQNTANSSTQGIWQYHKGGADWVDIPTLNSSTNEVFALQANWSLRFKPATNFNGEAPQLTVRLIDSSTGSSSSNPSPSYGNKQDNTIFTAAALAAMNADNGVTRYSKDEITLGVSVTQVNDAPTSADIPLTIKEDKDYSGTVSSLFGSVFNDGKDDKQTVGGSTASTKQAFAGVFITGNAATTAQGTWQYSTVASPGNGDWINIPTSGLGDNNALYVNAGTNIRFVSKGDFNGTVGQLSFRVVEAGDTYTVGQTHDIAANITADGHISKDTTASKLTVKVTAVNDAPVAKKDAVLAAIDEDSTSPGGDTVGNLFGSTAGVFDDSKDTVPGGGGSSANGLKGIVITANAAQESEGTWEYKKGSGSWTAITASTTSALYLDAADKIRFVPKDASNYNGTPGKLTVHLVDNSTAVAGENPALPALDANNKFNFSSATKGGDSRYSTALKLSTEVNAINDAPTATNTTVNFWPGAIGVNGDLEDVGNSATGKSVTSLFSSIFNDESDQQKNAGNTNGSELNLFAGIVIVGNSADADIHGTWQYSKNNGSDWDPVGTRTISTGLFLDNAGTTLLRFVPKGDFNGEPPALIVRLVDDSTATLANPAAPANGDPIDISSAKNGGVTRYSNTDIALKTFIKPVNDAPTVNGGPNVTVTHTINEDPDSNYVGFKIEDFLSGKFNDGVDAQKTNGGTNASDANGWAGIVLVEQPNSTNGTWYYKTGGGSWQAVPGDLSLSKGLYLSTADSLKFIPEADYNKSAGFDSLKVLLVDDSAADAANGNPALPAGGDRVFGLNATKGKGFNTRYSDDAITIKMIINPINDAPKVVNGTTETLGTITEDIVSGTDTSGINPGKTVSNIFINHFYDGRDDVSGGSDKNDFAGVLITQNTADFATQGVWQYHKGGTDWVDIPLLNQSNREVFALEATWSLRFKPALDFNGEAPKLTVRLIDSSSAAPVPTYGGKTTLTDTDLDAITADNGTTPYSKDTITLGVSVTPVNDIPAIIGDMAITTKEDKTYTNTVSDLFSSVFNDTNKDNQKTADNPTGSTSQAFAGVFITGNAATAAQGTWQYSTVASPGESDWIGIPTSDLSDNKALYLSEGTKIRFMPKSDFNGTVGQLSFRVVEVGDTYDVGQTHDISSKIDPDGSGHISTGASSKLTVSVIPVNDAPVAKKDAFLAAIDEDSTSPGGDTVGNLFGSTADVFDDSKDEVLGSGGSSANGLKGIVITANAADASHGTWQYQKNGSSGWTAITASESSALYLDAADKIRFVPKDGSNYNGTPGKLTVHLVDDSTAVAGENPALPALDANNKFNFSSETKGGDSRYSSAFKLSTKVNAINDAPTATNTTVNFWPGAIGVNGDWENVAADDTTGKSVTSLFSSIFNDESDQQKNTGNTNGSERNNFAGIVIVGNSADANIHGTWQYSKNNGSDWDPVGTRTISTGLFLDNAGTTLLRFVPKGDFNGEPPALIVRLVDDSADSANPAIPNNGNEVAIDGANNGGITRYSNTDIALKTFIKPVNDAPTVNGGLNVTVTHTIDEDPDSNYVGFKIEDFLSGKFNDGADAQKTVGGTNASDVNNWAGIVLTETFNSTNGTWHYKTDGGSWQALPEITADHGFYLSTADSLKFIPTTNYNNLDGFDSLKVFLVDDSTADEVNGNPRLPNSEDRVLGLDMSDGRGHNTRYSTDFITIQIAVTPVNDAPKVVNGTTENLPAILEDTPNPAGETVKNLFHNGSSTHFNDADDNSTSSTANNFAGVLITGHAHNSTIGEWEYSINGGTDWIKLSEKGTLSDSNALFLNADAKLRFLPASNWSGVPGTLTVRLVDNSDANATVGYLNPDVPANNTLVNVAGQVGGVTRYSDSTITLSTSVTEVNNAPIATQPLVAVDMDAINEDYAPIVNQGGQLVKDLFLSRFNDNLDAQGNSTANELAGILVKNISTPASQGQWQYWNGSSWANLADGMFVRSTDKIRFAPALDFNQSTSVTGLSVYLAEKSGPIFFPNNPADYPASGTQIAYNYDINGAFSQDALDVQIKVNAVNDAPVAQKDAVLAAIDEDVTNPSGETVKKLFNKLDAGVFDDSKDEVLGGGGSNANGFKGIVITANAANASHGTWEYQKNGSGPWTAITASESSALYLDTADKIRFVPKAGSNYNGKPGGLTIHLVDNSIAVAGENPALPALDANNKFNFSSESKGGNSRYSTAFKLSTEVNAINDAPTATNTTVNFWPGAIGVNGDLEDVGNSATGKSVTSLFSSIFNDESDQQKNAGNTNGSERNNFAGIVIVGNSADANIHGTWQYSKDNGGSWDPVGARTMSTGLFLDSAAATLLRFVPKGDFNGEPPALIVRLVDDSADSANPAIPNNGNEVAIDGANNGGITRYSNTDIALKTFIKPINDAPTINGANTINHTVYEDPNSAYDGFNIGSFLDSKFNDSPDAQKTGGGANASDSNSWAGIVLVEKPNSANGTWYYKSGTGSWQAVPGDISLAKGFYLLTRPLNILLLSGIFYP